MRVSIDDAGQVDWTIRGEASRDLDPDKVALERRRDQRRHAHLQRCAERLLVSPHRHRGDRRGALARRSVAGRRQLQLRRRRRPSSRSRPAAATRDGSLRVKADVTPGQWPIAIAADGVIAQDDSRARLYRHLQPDAGRRRRGGRGRPRRCHRLAERGQLHAHPRAARRRQGGAFRRPARPAVEPRRLDDADPRQVGSRFFATVQARQLDLDRSLGEGPKKPIEMATAADEFVKWLRGIPVPAHRRHGALQRARQSSSAVRSSRT